MKERPWAAQRPARRLYTSQDEFTARGSPAEHHQPGSSSALSSRRRRRRRLRCTKADEASPSTLNTFG